MERTWRRLVIVFGVFFLLQLGMSSPANAQDLQCVESSSSGSCKNVSCIGEDLEPGDNFFGCGISSLAGGQWIGGGQWMVGGLDGTADLGEEGCAEGYMPSPACSGNWSGNQPCGKGATYCCLSCVPIPTEDILPRGAACGEGIDGVCDPGNALECRNGQCVYATPRVVFGGSCYDTQECLSGTSNVDPLEAVACRSGKCDTASEERYCHSDLKCQELMNNPDAKCITNLCMLQQTPKVENPKGISPESFDYCRQVPGNFEDKTTQRGACYDCVTQGDPGEYIFTAVGCIHVADDGDFLPLAEDLIRLLLGVAGGAAFLSILAAAFILTTSRGETSKVKQAKELITAAVSGLLFIIFSIIILDYIGVTILHIPGLS